MHPTRRQLLRTAGTGLAALALAPLAGRSTARAADLTSPYTLPPLPYANDALEPHIDAKTMEIHHDRHHQTYVTNLNDALKDQPELQKKDLPTLLRELDKVPMAIRDKVRNNGGGHLNHTMFWQMMAPKAGGAPSGDLAKAIDAAFGSFDKMQAAFNDAAAGRFGSGWAWLVVGKGGKLEVTSTANQDHPVMTGGWPVLGVDVWEHAYYLKYQNKRADYVKAWWNVVNWKYVADLHAKAPKA